MTEALRLADALASRARGAQILVVTDDAGGSAPALHAKAPIRVLTVGRERHNQAISALAVQTGAGGVKRSLFVSVANLDAQRVERRVQVLADGVPFTARDVYLDPLTQTQVIIDELPAGTSVVEARLTASDTTDDGAAPTGLADQLAADDAAWAIVPSDRLQRILLVGPGNVYLQNALSLLPNVELYGATGRTTRAPPGSTSSTSSSSTASCPRACRPSRSWPSLRRGPASWARSPARCSNQASADLRRMSRCCTTST